MTKFFFFFFSWTVGPSFHCHRILCIHTLCRRYSRSIFSHLFRTYSTRHDADYQAERHKETRSHGVLHFHHHIQRNSISWVVLNEVQYTRRLPRDKIADSRAQFHFSFQRATKFKTRIKSDRFPFPIYLAYQIIIKSFMGGIRCDSREGKNENVLLIRSRCGRKLFFFFYLLFTFIK